MAREFLDRSAQRWALIRRIDQANTNLAIFVHGFRGNYLSTWGNLPEALTERADRQAPFDRWDYVFIGYETSTVSNLLAIADLLNSQWKIAVSGQAPFDHCYDQVALFGHSLGTLGIRQLLCATCE